MKKGVVVLMFLAVALSGFTWLNTYRRVPNQSFGPGEHLEYRVHYGFLNAAEATVDVAPMIYRVNDRMCYKVNVHGRTVGAFDLVTRVRDTWRSYIDTTAILPQKFYANIQEGGYRKEENITFNHAAHTVRAEERTERDVFRVPENVHDVVSGYYFLRTIDFNRLSVGQTIEVPAFYDDTVYNMKVKYQGKSTIKTRFGRINVLRLMPVMPPNGFFKGDNAIRIWVSDDANKIPVKVEVDLAIGALEMDLRRHAGLKQKPRFF